MGIYLIMNKCVHYWIGVVQVKPWSILISPSKNLFCAFWNHLEIGKKQIVYAIDNIKTCLSLVLFDLDSIDNIKTCLSLVLFD